MKQVILGVVGGLMLASSALAEGPQMTVVREALEQAGFLIGKVPVGSTVTLDGKALWVGKQGDVVMGFDREAKPEAELKICDADKACSSQTLQIEQRTYITQNVKGIPQETVEPDKSELTLIEADNKATAAAKTVAEKGAGERLAFLDVFVKPIEGPTPNTGVFGSRRTYNGEERSWHKGHDFAAKTGTPVKAPAAGVVRLARSTFMSGNLIMLDHGGAITTVYAHLSEMDVKVGDVVKEGDVIGKVGTTGRSSGPHLHWGAYWQNTAIDPILWVAK